MEVLDTRISRIVGQLRGIQKMLKSDRGGKEILQQISAVKKAIDGLTKEIMLLYISASIPDDKKKELGDLIKQAIDL